PDRLFQAVEARDLGDHGPLAVNAEVVAHLLNIGFVEIFVLFREWIDAGIKKVLRDGKLPGECRGREDTGIVLLDERLQEIPHFAVRIGKVDVAAPDPLAAVSLLRADQAGWLRVVDNEKVLNKLHTLPI